jgi:hypothetical protein
MPRLFLVVFAAALLSAGAVPAQMRPVSAADCAPAQALAAEKTTAAVEAPGRAAGSVGGKVADIDYRGSRMTVTAGKRCYDILIQPSTNIVGKGKGFYEIADIKRGARVQVLLSEKGGAYIAQIIHLL